VALGRGEQGQRVHGALRSGGGPFEQPAHITLDLVLRVLVRRIALEEREQACVLPEGERKRRQGGGASAEHG